MNKKKIILIASVYLMLILIALNFKVNSFAIFGILTGFLIPILLISIKKKFQRDKNIYEYDERNIFLGYKSSHHTLQIVSIASAVIIISGLGKNQFFRNLKASDFALWIIFMILLFRIVFYFLMRDRN